METYNYLLHDLCQYAKYDFHHQLLTLMDRQETPSNLRHYFLHHLIILEKKSQEAYYYFIDFHCYKVEFSATNSNPGILHLKVQSLKNQEEEFFSKILMVIHFYLLDF